MGPFDLPAASTYLPSLTAAPIPNYGADVPAGQYDTDAVAARDADAAQQGPPTNAAQLAGTLQQQQQAKQAQLATDPRTGFGEIAARLKGGFTSQLPRMAGYIAKALTPEGSTAYNVGQTLTNYGDQQGVENAPDENPGAHGFVVNSLADVAGMIGPIAGVAAGAAGLVAALPEEAIGAATAGAITGAAMFAPSQYQETYEKAVASGKSPEEAQALGLMTGGISGAAGAASAFAGGESIVNGLSSGIAKYAPRILGQQYGADAALTGLQNPRFVALLAKETHFGATLAKEAGLSAAAQTSIGVAQAASVAGVEHGAGIDPTDAWTAATGAISPMMALSGALVLPEAMGLKARINMNRANVSLLKSSTATLEMKRKAADQLGDQLLPLMGQEQVGLWKSQVLEDANRQNVQDQLAEAKAGGVGTSTQNAGMTNPDGTAIGKPPVSSLPDYSDVPPRSALPPYTNVGDAVDAYGAKTPEQQAIDASFAGDPKQYAGADDAQSLWDTFGSQYEAIQNATDLKQRAAASEQLFRQVATMPKPAGVMSFPDFVKEERTGPRDLGDGGQKTATGIKQAYLSYLNDQADLARKRDAIERNDQGITPEERAAQEPLPLGEQDQITPFERAAQGNLDLTSDPNSRPPFELEPSREARQPPDEPPPGGGGGTPEGQGELDLMPLMNGKQRDAVPVPQEPAREPTIMEQAFAKAGGTKPLEESRAWEERNADNTRPPPNEPPPPPGGPGAPVRSEAPRTIDTVARKNASAKLADDAIAGKINGNTPLAVSDLRRAWKVANDAQGRDLKALDGEAKATKSTARQNVERVFAAVQGKGQYVNQLNALVRARDALGKGTVTRDSFTALINHLKDYQNGKADRTASGVSDVPGGEGRAAVPTDRAQGVSQGFQDPLSEAVVRGEEGNAEAAAVHEEGQVAAQPSTAPGSGEAVPPPAVKPAPDAVVTKKAGTEAPPGEQKPPPAPPQPAKEMRVGPKGELGLQDARPVGYGEHAYYGPDGTVNYDVPDAVKALARSFSERDRARAQAIKDALAKVEPKSISVPSSMQRKVPVGDKFAFERTHYQPNQPRGDVRNLMWVRDFARATAEADESKRPAGVSDKDAANARDALAWLKAYSPDEVARAEDTKDVAGRMQQLDKISEKNQKLREVMEDNTTAIMKADEDAYRNERKAEKGIPYNNKLTDADIEELKRRARSNISYLTEHAEMPNYTYSDTLSTALGKGNLDHVLHVISQNPPTPWVHTMAQTLRGLGMDTKVQLHGMVARDADGNRVYGRYDHGTNTVNIYVGGENVHTVLHELAHAATVGRIQMGEDALRKPAALRTPMEKVHAAAVQEIKDLMAQMKAKGGSGYAFKNTKEFVAEAFSNEKFQNWLSRQTVEDTSLWGKFRDWVRDLFGMTPIEGDNALERVMKASYPVLDGSRYGADRGLSFNHSITGAEGKTDGVVKALTKTWDKLASNVDGIANAPRTMRAIHYAVSTTYNLGKIAERVPGLRTVLESVKAFQTAVERKRQLIQDHNFEAASVIKPLRYFMKGLSKEGRAALDAKIQEVAGEGSRWDLDVRKSFDEQLKDNPKLDPALREHANKLNMMYKQLPKEARDGIQDSVKLFRKGYMERSAAFLLNTLRRRADNEVYRGKLDGMISQLDIHNDAMKEGTLKSDEERGYYLDAHAKNIDSTMKDVFDQINKLTKDDVDQDGHPIKGGLRAEVMGLKKYYNDGIHNPYTHLGRSGDFVLSFHVTGSDAEWAHMASLVEPSGKIIGAPNKNRFVYLKFENATQRDVLKRTLEKQAYISTEPDKQLVSTTINDAPPMQRGSLDAFVQAALAGVDESYPDDPNDSAALRAAKADSKASLYRTIQEMIPDNSAQAQWARRTDSGVSGFDASFMRSFAKASGRMASSIANGAVSHDFTELFKRMREGVDAANISPGGGDEASSMHGELMKRYANMMTPVNSPTIDAIKSAGFNFYLAFSPAFMVTNLVQPFQMTLPHLGARYGFVRSAKELAIATKDAGLLMKTAIADGWATGRKSGGVGGAAEGVLDLDLQLAKSGLTPGEQGMIMQLMRSGQLDTTQGKQLSQIAQGKTPKFATAMQMMSAGAHYTEVLNRLSTALSSYRLETKSAKFKGHDTAVLNAIKAVRETQFDYSDTNAGSAFGRHGALGKITPLVASFAQFRFQTLELITRLAKDSMGPVPKGLEGDALSKFMDDRAIAQKQFAWMLGTTSVLAGTLGLPFAALIARGADQLLGDRDNPVTTEGKYREWLASVFGPQTAMAIAEGIPRAFLGFDTAEHMGFAKLLPGTDFMLDRRALKDKLADSALDFAGPAIGAGAGILEGAGMMADGNIIDGLIKSSPSAIRGFLKDYKMSVAGYTNSANNELPIPVTPWSYIAQAGGFTPTPMAEHEDAQFMYDQRMELLQDRSQVLLNAFYRAHDRGEDTSDALQKIAAFKAANPTIGINAAEGLKKRAIQRGLAGTNNAAVLTPARFLPLLQQYKDFNPQ